ncbi:MAG: hypothetical protein MJZ51_04255 [Bacteroidales bacterium]|nr:hypothetical protein [Bacteroidales bacterium]
MKRILTAILLTAVLSPIWGQEADSAAMIVDRFVAIMNMKDLPRDSMVMVTSIQIDRDNPSDTTIMKRWDAWPNKNRSEVWYHGRMLDGFVSDGIQQHMYFDTIRRAWRNCMHVQYLDNYVAYDIRGPLYYWRTNGSELKYLGELSFQGKPIYGVEISMLSNYTRQYFFEKESGLLFLYKMTDHLVGDSIREEYITDWRAYHEYQKKGACIFPEVESYQNQGHVYIIHHQVEYVPYDEKVFKQSN